MIQQFYLKNFFSSRTFCRIIQSTWMWDGWLWCVSRMESIVTGVETLQMQYRKRKNKNSGKDFWLPQYWVNPLLKLQHNKLFWFPKLLGNWGYLSRPVSSLAHISSAWLIRWWPIKIYFQCNYQSRVHPVGYILANTWSSTTRKVAQLYRRVHLNNVAIK